MSARTSHKSRWNAPRQILPVLLPLLLLTGCNWRQSKTLPTLLVGEWSTDEPRYHGRSLKLEPDRITFGLGGVAPDKSEHVERVKMSPSDDPTDYAIKLRTEDGTRDSLLLEFNPENGELRLKNQPAVVWKRKGEHSEVPQQSHPMTRRKALPLGGINGEHQTVYKIDCLRPDLCGSY
jgi:hypothetical protein